MASIGSYSTTAFSEDKKFLVLDPATQSAALVSGADLVGYITPSLTQVFTETTRAAALTTDYQIGQFVQTAGATAIDDGGNGLYIVVAGGDGDYAMMNGNDLLLLPFGSLAGSNLDGALVTDDGSQVDIEDAIALRPVQYGSMEAVRLSTTSHDYIETTSFYASGTTGAAKLYRDGTGTPTGSGAAVIAAALAAGTFCNAGGICYKLKPDQNITPFMMGVYGNGDGAGGGTNDATCMQIFLNYVRDTGGGYRIDGNFIFRCDTGLTLLSNSTARRSYIVDFGGAVFDFSASAATSGDFFAIGATSQANAHDNEIDNIRNFRIIGNEPSFNTATVPTTSCVGVSLEYSLRLRLENVFVQSCYEGFKTNWVFDLQTDNCQAIACYVGLRIDDTSTYALWNNWQAINNRYGTVVKPGTSGAIAGNQTFVNPRFEGNSVGCAIDGGTNASFGIRSLTFINTYAENNTYDLFREGLQWTIADPATRNAACVGYVVNTTILGGDWSGMTWGASCAAIAWPSAIGTVLGGEYRIPATIANCVNYPGKSTYQQVLDLTAGLGQNMQPTSMPGYGVVVIRGSDGLLTISNNLISSTSRTGVGVYEINFREAFTGSTDYAVGATCDDGYVEIDTASCTASKLVLNCFSNAGVAIDPARVRVMVHGVLT